MKEQRVTGADSCVVCQQAFSLCIRVEEKPQLPEVECGGSYKGPGRVARAEEEGRKGKVFGAVSSEAWQVSNVACSSPMSPGSPKGLSCS